MSLDCWLARGNQQLPLTPQPVLKRAKSANIDTEPVSTRSPAATRAITAKRFCSASNIDNFCSRIINAPPRITAQHLKDVPEGLQGRRKLFGWQAADRFQGDEHIASLECLRDAPLAILGLDNGEVDIVQCRTEPGLLNRHVSVGSCKYSKAVPPSWPIIDLAAMRDSTVVCASKRGIAMLNINRQEVSEFREHEDDEITHVSVNKDQNLLALSGSRGSVGLIDYRDPNNFLKVVSDAHSVLNGPQAHRKRPAISALEWAGEHLLATGSQSNETVKFWDIRNMRRGVPVMGTASQTGPNKCQGGINSLRSSKDGTVWSLTRDGVILKLNFRSRAPEYRLVSPKLRISSPCQGLDLIGPTADNYGLSRGPSYPLIAACSDLGVILATEPSDASYKLGLDATFASILNRVSGDSSLPRSSSTVKWHPYTKELISVIANRGWEVWAHEDPAKSSAKPVKIRMTHLCEYC